MLTGRQKLILERVVQEYIDSAQPVSSRLLEEKYHFGISSATIRNEMQQLTKKRFLWQPHTSAGRVPTDLGYRFFVDNLFEREFKDFEIENWLEEESDDPIKFTHYLTKKLAQISKVLAIGYLEKEKIIWKEGWSDILKEPEFKDRDYLISFVEFLENFEKEIERLISSLKSADFKIKVFIGRENSFKKGKEFSIIFSKGYLPKKRKIVFSLLGPKRMAYERNISLLNSLIKSLEKF